LRPNAAKVSLRHGENMIIKLAEYTIKENELDAVLSAIRTFVTAIYQNEPSTFYEAFRRDKSLDFVHIMKFPDEDAESKHSGATYTDEFVKVLYPRCTKEPVFTDVSEIE